MFASFPFIPNRTCRSRRPKTFSQAASAPFPFQAPSNPGDGCSRSPEEPIYNMGHESLPLLLTNFVMLLAFWTKLRTFKVGLVSHKSQTGGVPPLFIVTACHKIEQKYTVRLLGWLFATKTWIHPIDLNILSCWLVAGLVMFVFFRCLPVDFAKIPSRTFNFLRRSVSREGSREGSPHVSSGYASGRFTTEGPQHLHVRSTRESFISLH